MLAKRKRLTKQAFDGAFKNGKRVHSPSLQLIYAPGDSFHGAVVVGKKVYKGAVQRNRLRRQLYGVMYRLSQKETLSGTFILVAKPGLKEIPSRQFVAEVGALFGKC